MPYLNKITQWANTNPEMAKNILLVAGALTGLIAGLASLAFAV